MPTQLLIIFFALISLTASAQQWEPRFKAALIAGANASQIDGDNLAGYHKWGFNGGAKAYAMINDKLSVSVELLFAQKGSRSTKFEVNPDSAVNVTINYAEIPLMLNYHDQGRAIFSIGASYARTLDYRYKKGDLNTTAESPAILNRDISFLAGVTFIIRKKFGVNLRYNYSLAPIGYNQFSKLKDNKMLNGAISLRAMFFFN